MPVLAANKTEVMFDGEKVPGLKGFAFKVFEDKQEVRGIGSEERLGVVYGRLHIKGQILVHSNAEFLNKKMIERDSFQVVVRIDQTSYPEDSGKKSITFDGCHLDDREFTLDANGYALTTYTFTADRLREE
ncbi:MAG TPA: hypothetical protein VI893_01740 [Thermoplasmata archaeon]|nr:hypothetical protein [Thermoplasmata archaeon]